MSLEFEAEEVQQSIPSRSTYAPSNKQKSYVAGDTIRFHLPTTDAFLDPRMSFLTFNVKVSHDVLVRFSNKCGAHSLIENVRIYDANTNLQLETLQNYNAMAQKLHLYSENKSIRNKRGLIECLEYTSRDFDGEYYDNLPARNADQSQLFNHQYKTGDQATYTATASPTSDPNVVQICLHLYSGIIGQLSQKMFPIVLTDGLRIEVDTANPNQALEPWTGEGIVYDNGEISTTLAESSRFCIDAATPNAAAPLTSIELNCERNAGYNQVPNTNFPTQACIDAGATIVKNQLVGAINLVVGTDLYGWNNVNPPVWQRLGEIVSVDCNAGENAGGAVRVRVVLDGTGANGDEYQGGGGNGAAGVGVEKTNTCGMRIGDLFSTEPVITFSEVQFIVKTIQPPASYISSMMKQASTAEGLQYDYLTLDTYRNNALANERVIQLNIPTLNHRATSIMTLPLNNSQALAVQNRNLDTITDDATNYNYIIDNQLQPTRKVRLSQLSQIPARTEQVALFETEKALSGIRVHPKNLDYQDTNFFVARSLARYGGVYNLAETGNASLRMEFNNPTKNKLMITYIGGLRRLVINKDGRYIET